MKKIDLIKEEISNLTELERFKIINSIKVNPMVLEYVKEKLKYLTIKLGSSYENNIINLMKCNKLEGNCWATTEAAIVFFNDIDLINRGYLTFAREVDYYHSWISFKYKKSYYIFDPCLNILCKKDIYEKLFTPKIIACVNAKEVSDDLISAINNPELKELTSDKTYISGNDNPNSTMFRNNTGYIAEIENNKVRKLFAHIYSTE